MKEKYLNGYMEGYAAASVLSKEAGATAEVLKQLGAAGLGAGLGAGADYAITGDVGWGAPVAGAAVGSGAYNAYKYRKELAKMLGLGGGDKAAKGESLIAPMPDDEIAKDIEAMHNRLKNPAFTPEQVAKITSTPLSGLTNEDLAMHVDRHPLIGPEKAVAGLTIDEDGTSGLNSKARAIVEKYRQKGPDDMSPEELTILSSILPLVGGK